MHILLLILIIIIHLKSLAADSPLASINLDVVGVVGGGQHLHHLVAAEAHDPTCVFPPSYMYS